MQLVEPAVYVDGGPLPSAQRGLLCAWLREWLAVVRDDGGGGDAERQVRRPRCDSESQDSHSRSAADSHAMRDRLA